MATNDLNLKINILSDFFDFSKINCLKSSCLHNRNSKCMLKEIVIGTSLECNNYNYNLHEGADQ